LKAEEEEQKTESKRRFEEMVDLKKEIAANAVTLEEATKNRAAEKAENEVTLAETKGSIQGCTLALEILKRYYDSVALVQVKEEPAADRNGKTLKDHAPSYTTEAKDYAGSSGAEKVLGAIEDLQKELEATESEVTNDESQAVTDFEKLKEDTNADTDAKEKAHTEAETIRNNCEARIVTIQDDKADAQNKSPYRAFAYAQFCSGRPYSDCWTSDRVSFSFSFKTEGLAGLGAFGKLLFWTDAGNIAGFLPPRHPKGEGKLRLVTEARPQLRPHLNEGIPKVATDFFEVPRTRGLEEKRSESREGP